jgi:hypothetical protein
MQSSESLKGRKNLEILIVIIPERTLITCKHLASAGSSAASTELAHN